MTDNFNGDTPHLIRCIAALLKLDGLGLGPLWRYLRKERR